MKCRLCGEELDDYTSGLEEHLWSKHDNMYRARWSNLVKSFFQSEPLVVGNEDGGNEKKPCDMVDTDLCKHYQKQIQCHYESTHNVKCLIETGATE